jgi:hypothetical protein
MAMQLLTLSLNLISSGWLLTMTRQVARALMR